MKSIKSPHLLRMHEHRPPLPRLEYFHWLFEQIVLIQVGQNYGQKHEISSIVFVFDGSGVTLTMTWT